MAATSYHSLSKTSARAMLAEIFDVDVRAFTYNGCMWVGDMRAMAEVPDSISDEFERGRCYKLGTGRAKERGENAHGLRPAANYETLAALHVETPKGPLTQASQADTFVTVTRHRGRSHLVPYCRLVDGTDKEFYVPESYMAATAGIRGRAFRVHLGSLQFWPVAVSFDGDTDVKQLWMPADVSVVRRVGF